MIERLVPLLSAPSRAHAGHFADMRDVAFFTFSKRLMSNMVSRVARAVTGVTGKFAIRPGYYLRNFLTDMLFHSSHPSLSE
jgi:hypothetical protein